MGGAEWWSGGATQTRVESKEKVARPRKVELEQGAARCGEAKCTFFRSGGNIVRLFPSISYPRRPIPLRIQKNMEQKTQREGKSSPGEVGSDAGVNWCALRWECRL